MASGLHVKWTRSCPASFRLLKLYGVQCPDRPHLSRRPGIPPFTDSRHGQAGWENLASLAPRPSIPWAHPGWSSRAAPSPASLSPGALPAAQAASMAPGRVQKATWHAPSRRTKGHIDWFVGAFPGVLYISLPRCCNEESKSTEEGRGRHTCIRVGFLHLINQDFN